MTDAQKEAKRARWRKWYQAHPDYRRSHAQPKPERQAEPVQKELIPAKKPAERTHYGYPPFYICPCLECKQARDNARLERARASLAGVLA